MLRDAVRWLVSSLVLLFVITALTFVLASLAPGDAAKAILSSQSGSYTVQQYQQMRHALGIDQPLPVQYWHWLDGVLHGSLGADLFSGQPVTQELNARLGPSLSIIVGTVIVSGLVGVSLGIVSGLGAGRSAGSSMPCHWQGWRSRTSGSPSCWSNCSRSASRCSRRPGTRR